MWIPTRYGILLDIRNMLAGHIEESRRISGNGQKSRPLTRGFLFLQKYNAISKRIKALWHKIPEAGTRTLIYGQPLSALSYSSCCLPPVGVQWHEYREGNRRLRTVADKHKVTTVMIRELYSELAVPVGAYEKLVETVGLDSTLAVFHRQLEKMKSEESEKGN